MSRDVEFFRQEYQKQKKLEKIVNSRVLKRPKIKKWQVTASFVILPFLMFFATYIPCKIALSTPLKILTAIFLEIVVFESYLRFCLVGVVKCYQRYARKDTRKRCKCIPSCSEYAVICLKRIFPLLLALLKIRKRLYVTCNGEEYKIDFPLEKMRRDFESKL